MGSKFVEYENVIPLLCPKDIIATANEGNYVDMKTLHDLAFYVFMGILTSASNDEPVGITVLVSTTSASASEAACAFNYRSCTVGGSWGAVTACGSTGLSISSDSGVTAGAIMYMLQVDPAVAQSTLADARYARVTITPDAESTKAVVATFAIGNPRYKGASMVSTSS